MKVHSLVLSLGVILVGAMPAPSRAGDAPLSLPVAPEDLLKVLPQPPAEWTLTRSQAQTTLGTWLQTRALRVFHAPPPVSAAAGEGSVEIAVVDTGGFKQALGDFAGFKPGKDGPLERLLIAGYPALQFPDSAGNLHSQILLASRYLVEIKITALPAEKIESWLRALRFDGLPRPTPASSAALPSVVRLSSIDELDPARNRSYSVSVSTNPKLTEDAPTPAASPDAPREGQDSDPAKR